MDKAALQALIREILAEKLAPLQKIEAPTLTEADRLDPNHRVYTRDLLQNSPRLGAGLMTVEGTFPWKLTYDEVDIVLEGTLTVRSGGTSVTALPGQGIYIPKDTAVEFTSDHAKFYYVTYPADWK